MVVVMELLLAFAFGTIFFCFFFFFVVIAITDFILVEDTTFICFLLMHELIINSVDWPSHFLLSSMIY